MISHISAHMVTIKSKACHFTYKVKEKAFELALTGKSNFKHDFQTVVLLLLMHTFQFCQLRKKPQNLRNVFEF